MIPPYLLPSLGTLPLSLALGISKRLLRSHCRLKLVIHFFACFVALGQLGSTGNTAYFGFLDVCQPKAGEVVVVSGAGGAVGNVVGQIAKIKRCKVIGITGSDEKCAWLTNELGFDHAVNYKTDSVSDKLKEFAPDGVDCYFDNVGGEISANVLDQMRLYGRVSVCGTISTYNVPMSEWPKVPMLQPIILLKRLTIKGFHVSSYYDKWFDGINQMKQWTEEGKIKYHETVTDGFENMPQAFIDMLQGKNTGKAIVKP